jgi:subtilase family serine protease
VITALAINEVTVKNQGTAAAGAFTVSVPGGGIVRIAGLAAGASVTSAYTTGNCNLSDYRATVDPGNAVTESDETNNVSGLTVTLIC